MGVGVRVVGREQERAGGAAPKRRRREVSECLAAYGLRRGPRRLLREAEGEPGLGRRLRLALESLGGAFAAFGLYAAGRADLLSATDCRELAALPDWSQPAPAAAVMALLEREVGGAPEAVFSFFEELPFESRLLWQSHRARLADGTPVVVKLTRPEAHFADDLGLLQLLKEALADEEWTRAAADFRRTLRRQLDLRNEAAAFRALARDAEGFEALRAPAVFGDLCSARVLTVEELPDARPADVVAGARGDAPGAGGEELARLLCLAWLRQALLGSVFPVEPRAANILVVTRTQLAFTGGAFTTLRPESQANLRDYLIAVSTEDPDRACSCLLRELDGRHEPGRDRLLRQKLRQVMPFRDWGREGGAGPTLAEHSLLHWRLVSEHGYAPRAHLVSFYRGLFAVAALAQRLSPESDALLEGLRDLRLTAGLSQLREMVGLEELGGQMDRYAALLAELPQRLDDVLTLASDGSAHLGLHPPEVTAARRRKSAVASAMSLLAVVVSLALLLRAMADSGVWQHRIGAVVFTLCGLLLLRAVSRIR